MSGGNTDWAGGAFGPVTTIPAPYPRGPLGPNPANDKVVLADDPDGPRQKQADEGKGPRT